MTEQPSGTVTLVFTDIEGSTRLLEELGQEEYRRALGEHRRIVREAFARHSGYEVDYEGDAFFYAFASAQEAVSAVQEAMSGLEAGPIAIRVGVHTGEPGLDPPKYVGLDVHTAARIMSAGHGGQVLVSASTAPLCDLELRDLGEHRFKDLAAPERVYQLGGDDFPPLKTLYRTNLPVPATPFLGREQELADVTALLAGEGTRLVTLTGPGGTGKTRLALRAAAEVSDGFPDGVFWVALAPLRDPGLVATALAEAIEVSDVPGGRLEETLVRSLAARRTLLLLDNCEHLVDEVAGLAKALVEGCPHIVLEASSRERLGLRAERVYAVPSMEAADSRALFVERARAVEARFEPDEHVQAICDAVDRLPLAVELAAARVTSLSTQTIVERLSERLSLLASRDRDMEARQRTLEATIDWSYDLLDENEQGALRALSVFAGGSTLRAAEKVAEADLDVLESLLDKSLIRHRTDQAHQDRYWMLETIREYATRELGREGEAEDIRERHLAWTLDFLREVAPRWGDPPPQDRLDQVVTEEGNIRVALERAIERREVDSALELVGLIGRASLEAGWFTKTRVWADQALELDGGDARVRGMALITSGYAAWSAQGIDAYSAATELLRAAGMPREAAYATMASGVLHGDLGSIDYGLKLLQTALAEFERLGEAYCISVTEGNIAALRGLRWPLDPAEARQVAADVRKALSEARADGDHGDEVGSLGDLSHALVDSGDYAEAREAALEAIAVIRGKGVGRAHLPTVLAALARSVAMLGQPREALVLRGALEAVLAELGRHLPPTRLAALEAAEAASREALDEQTALRAIAEGEAMSVESLLEYLAALADDTDA